MLPLRLPLLRTAWLIVSSLLLLEAPLARAATFTVTNSDDSGDGSLRQAILDANDSMDDDDQIVFAASVVAPIVLESSLPGIVGDVDVDGSGATAARIDGQGAHRVFFVQTGSVRIANLGVENGLGQGGDGAGRGGGGLGAGGGLFVDDGASVTLDSVDFDGNAAVGGSGGDGSSDGGGGGGFRGNGGANLAGAGGGGGFSIDGLDDDEDGGAGTLTTGGDGGGGGAGPLGASGGAGGDSGNDGSDGGPLGGGGGAGPLGASGGAGGDFGGGGGATGAGTGGDGGFGGGGGGAGSPGTAGSGGFGAGNGATSGLGGGGSGLGGAVFVREGGTLRIEDGSFGASTANSVTGGIGAPSGEARGAALFVGDSVEAVISVSAGTTATLTETISGAGGIRKVDPGTLELLGANDYEGGTSIAAGTLRTNAASLPGAVANAGTLEFQQDVDGEFSGAVAGGGELVKRGSGELTLSGANSYTGGTRLEEGSLRGPTASLPGSIALASGTTVTFDENLAGTNAGAISGAGALVKEGGGTTILLGPNSYTGGTTVTDGTLQGNALSLQGAITNDASLVFDQTGVGTFSGTVTGSGSVTKVGDGELVVDDLQQAGPTSVLGGRLTLNGTIDNDVSVGALGILGGTGTVAGATTVLGTVAPGPPVGNPPGDTLSLNDVTFDSGSGLRVKVDPLSTTSDRVLVTTDARIDSSARVTIAPSAGSFDTAGTVYTILSAGTLTGAFAPTVAQDFAFLDTTVASVGNEVQLTVTRNANSFSSLASTRNQRNVGLALDQASPAPPGTDLAAVFANLETLTVSQYQRLLDDLGGESLTAFTTPQLANGAKYASVVMSRFGIVGGRALGSPGGVDFQVAGGQPWDLQQGLAGLLAGMPGTGSPGSFRPAAAGPTLSAAPGAGGRLFGVWADGYGVFGDVDGDRNSADTDWRIGSGVAGVDLRLGENALVGLSGGYAYLDVGVDDRSLDGDADIYQGALYGGWVGERFYMGGLARYAYTDFETKRSIVFSGISRRTRADYDGNEVGGFLETGYVALAPAGIQIEPTASIHYTWLDREKFTESGAGSLNLSVDSETWHSLVASFGVRFHRSFVMETASNLRFVPELWARFGHEFGDRDRELESRLAGSRYSVDGARVARGGAQYRAGWSITGSNDLSARFFYEGGVNEDIVVHSVSMGFLMRW